MLHSQENYTSMAFEWYVKFVPLISLQASYPRNKQFWFEGQFYA